MGLFSREGQIADLVDDQDRITAERLHEAVARGAEEDQVLAPGDEVQRGELLDLPPRGRRGEAEVVRLQRLGRGKACAF